LVFFHRGCEHRSNSSIRAQQCTGAP
jgi:hypothetical protein